MGLSFENLILGNLHLILKKLSINRHDVLWSGPFFQSATSSRKGCQIDLLISCRFNTVYICEIKFSENEISHEVTRDVKEKIKRLDSAKTLSIRPVLISAGAVSQRLVDSRYFDRIIHGEEILSCAGD